MPKSVAKNINNTNFSTWYWCASA